MRRSLQARLSLALTLAILLVAVGAGGFGFISAYRESIRVQDDLLMQVGALLARVGGSLPAEGAVGSYPGNDHESRISVQWLPGPDTDTDTVGVKDELPLPAGLKDGFQTVFMVHEDFRVYVQPLPSGRRIVLAQETDARNSIAYQSAWRALLPVLILVPVLLLALRRIVRKLFAPLSSLRQEIDQRRDDQLAPIATAALPTEIAPFVEAINRLLTRVQNAMTTQRRFVADAAHELRTPLTALSLQAERLQQSELSDTARERLQRLSSGIERSKALVTQLLALARTQSQGMTEPVARSRFALREAVRPVLEDLLPLAQHKDIDLGVDSSLDAEVDTSLADLQLLLSNLIDNAIRYTPAGGCISLALVTGAQVRPGMARLELTDNGPGIPAAERERVFEPFYRLDPSAAPGSGLGLAIAQSLAQRLGITIGLEMADPVAQRGLRVVLDIPAPE
ncbi:sensor histidine kinase [Herbaspirillum rubrisubalbicans]|uniref:histidine kinase n=1 Tax=Herbaspirillum rubrisubalbicans TaxID=80842 RepID=A0AAD0XH70_9BURK|nr:HAMP domain-containing sensor histidine kinase [Herbaspirillum rubrisubalbicans]AYR24469.1 sensor histidine kinase [Herbaspirillum rubrisubalbicans]